MGNVVRIGDSVSCGAHSAAGSSNVFVNGLPVTHEGKRNVTGHGCFAPTVFNGPWTSTVFVNNEPVALKGVTIIVPHKCGHSAHKGTASSGSPDVSFEE
jgi:hypothetical protein